jgi:hypothetical protein
MSESTVRAVALALALWRGPSPSYDAMVLRQAERYVKFIKDGTVQT